MRALAVVVLAFAGCVPQAMIHRASGTLGVRGKHLHLDSHEEFADGDVYTFCRTESWFSPRRYGPSCVMYVCAKNAPASRCDETAL